MHKSDSSVQRRAEIVIMRQLENMLGLIEDTLKPQKVYLDNRTFVQFDGYCKDEQIIVEVSARIGNLKSAQQEKIANDILKMVMVEDVQGVKYRKIIAICDETGEKQLTGSSWKAFAIRHFDAEVIKVSIPDELRQEILNAQGQQSEGMKISK